MSKIIRTKIVVLSFISIILLPPIYASLSRIFEEGQTFYFFIFSTFLITSAVLIGYHILFYVQKKAEKKNSFTINSKFDNYIPFCPRWVFIYSLFYYFILGLPTIYFESINQVLAYIFGGSIILFLSLPFYYLWPTRCPSKWRDHTSKGASGYIITFIRQHDNGRSCIPSLHIAMTTYVSLFIPYLGISTLIIILIILSCLFIKQHSILDVIPSLVL